jgi:hypothetical protein
MGHQRQNVYASGGMIRCGRCGNVVTCLTKIYNNNRPSMGERMYMYSRYICSARNSPRRFGFKCSLPEFKVDELEQVVWEWIKSLEAIAAEVRAGAALVDNDKQAQRAIFQMLEVHVRLYHEDSALPATSEEKRWPTARER